MADLLLDPVPAWYVVAGFLIGGLVVQLMKERRGD